MTGRARVVDDKATAAAFGARFREREPAGVAGGVPGALAGGAHPRHRAALRAGAVADGARCLAGEAQRDRDAVERIGERQGDLGLNISAPAAPPGWATGTGRSAAPVEQAAEDVTEVARAGSAEHVAEVATGSPVPGKRKPPPPP